MQTEYLKATYNDDLRCAEGHLDESFSILNKTAYDDGSIATEEQIATIQRAMDQISDAVNNVIKSMD